MKTTFTFLLAAIASVTSAHAAVTESTVVSPGDDGCQYYRIPAIAKADNGNLIAVYDWRGDSNGDIKANGSSDRGRVKLMKKISSDNGLTWSGQSEMFPGFIGERDHGDAALVNDLAQNGHMVCVMATDAYYGTTGGKIFVSHTYDNGNSWSTPEEMQISNRPEWEKAFVSSGSMLYVTNGGTGTAKRDIMCVVLGKTKTEEKLYVLKSSDMGHSWTVVGKNDAGNESKLVEMADGSLLMSIRNKGNHKFARSTDGGATWTNFTSTITECGVNSAILPIIYGGERFYFMSIPDAPLSRANLSLYYSRNGSDWNSRLTLHNESAAYSDMIELDADRIGVLAEVAEGRSDRYTLKFYVVDKADVLPGQGKAENYDGSMVCNGKGYARIGRDAAFDIPAGGQMTVTCRVLLNGERVNQNDKTLDFGIISSRGYAEHTVKIVPTDRYAGFSGFGFIAGHDVANGQTFGTNVTFNGQNDSKKTCLANGYSDALKLSEWAHVAAVFDFSDSEHQVRIYVNGEEIETQTGAYGKAMSAPIGVLLGSRFDVDFEKNNFETFYGHENEASNGVNVGRRRNVLMFSAFWRFGGGRSGKTKRAKT